MSKFIYHITFALFLFSIILGIENSKKYSPNNEQNKRLQQAKSLRKSGLMEQSINVYYELLTDYPFLKEALDPLKIILKDREEWDTLNEILTNYQKAHNHSFQSKAETFEILLWTKNEEWKNILNDLKNDSSMSNKNIELILNALLNNNKINELINVLPSLRISKTPDYFSFQLGIFYSMNMEIENALEQLLIYLNYNPKKRTLIRNRVMAFPDIESIQMKIRDILNKSDINEAKLILADLEFKEKKYQKSYAIIKEYSIDDNEKISFVNNLIKLNEYELAQLVIKDILNESIDKKILKKAIIQSAKIFEKLLIANNYDLPISDKINKSELFNSKYIKVDESNSVFLNKAIAIYDSLSTSSIDNEAPYYLAEIKYRILGDLDGAQLLYEQIINNKRSQKLKYEATSRILDVMISKGELEKTQEKINELKNSKSIEKIEKLLDIKRIQVLFYQNNVEQMQLETEMLLKENIKNNKFYNDILKLKSNVLLFFDNNNELNQYSNSMLKIYQNKRTEAINIMSTLKNSLNNQISEKIIYELSYQNLLQGNINIALESLEQIPANSAYIESALLLKAEIYDYVMHDISKAVEIYLYFLDNFPDSIHYDTIRLRLRNLAS